MEIQDTTITHIAQVIAVNASAVSIAFAHINELLTTLSLTLACAYTIYKWIKDHSKKEDKDELNDL